MTHQERERAVAIKFSRLDKSCQFQSGWSMEMVFDDWIKSDAYLSIPEADIPDAVREDCNFEKELIKRWNALEMSGDYAGSVKPILDELLKSNPT